MEKKIRGKEEKTYQYIRDSALGYINESGWEEDSTIDMPNINKRKNRK